MSLRNRMWESKVWFGKRMIIMGRKIKILTRLNWMIEWGVKRTKKKLPIYSRKNEENEKKLIGRKRNPRRGGYFGITKIIRGLLKLNVIFIISKFINWKRVSIKNIKLSSNLIRTVTGIEW